MPLIFSCIAAQEHHSVHWNWRVADTFRQRHGQHRLPAGELLHRPGGFLLHTSRRCWGGWGCLALLLRIVITYQAVSCSCISSKCKRART